MNDASLRAPHPGGARLATWCWATAYLLQEVALPTSGTADHSIRTLAPFLLAAHPAGLLLPAAGGVLVAMLHDFRLHANLLISLTVLLMPFALLGTQRIRLDIGLFARIVIAALFGACVVQALFPGPANLLFSPFVDGYLRFEHPFERATGLSMEPSFAAEALFAAVTIHVFFARRFWSLTTVLAIGALLLIRAGTSVQQALLFGLVYLFLKLGRLAAGIPAGRARARLLPALLATVSALSAMLFGYSLLVYGTLDLSYVRDSMQRFHSWRTLSNYAAWAGAEPLAFFPHDSNAGWAGTISGTLRAHGLDGDEWVTQPFSAIGVACLDLGIAGAALWVALICAAAVRRLRRHALDTTQAAIVYTLLANTIFLAPKWQLSGYLAIGLIATALRNKQAGFRAQTD